MLRLAISCCAIAAACSVSRGDDPGLSLRVKVALALACDCGRCGDAKKQPPAPAKAAGRLDWFVSADAGVEAAPAPKVAPPAAKPAAPAPAKKAKGCACGVNCPKGGDCGPACDCPKGARMELASTPYKEVRAKVAAGTKVLMMVRPPAGDGQTVRVPVRLNFTTLRCDDAPFDAGLYRCDRSPAGAPQMEQEENWVQPMPPPAAVAPAPALDWQVLNPPAFYSFAECVGTA